MEHGEFRHRRLAALYDVAFGWGPDDDYFLAVADRTPAARILDLGCGTGRFTIAMAAAGHDVTGIDPAAASLAVARSKPGAEQVTWIEGSAAAAPSAAFDRAFMTSHVAQFLVDDDEWHAALAELARAIVPGGTLTYDARDPRARGWEAWNPPRSERRIGLPDGGHVDVVTRVLDIDDPTTTVHVVHEYAFADGEALTSTAALRFRTEEEHRRALTDAGFVVERIDGGWRGEPVGAGPDGELLVTARRAEAT